MTGNELAEELNYLEFNKYFCFLRQPFLIQVHKTGLVSKKTKELIKCLRDWSSIN